MVAGLLASLVACVLVLGVVSWHWYSISAQLKLALDDPVSKGKQQTLVERDKARQALKLANSVIEAGFDQVSKEHLRANPDMRSPRKRFLEQAHIHYTAILREYRPSIAQPGNEALLEEAKKGLERASKALKALELLANPS
jgi:hypothetical protein